jgi:hypothetical protein
VIVSGVEQYFDANKKFHEEKNAGITIFSGCILALAGILAMASKFSYKRRIHTKTYFYSTITTSCSIIPIHQLFNNL